jgi:murein DD-endopeptidase MepM/ murein hydrolase activator NlpD
MTATHGASFRTGPGRSLALGLLALLAMAASACASYPVEPRFPTRPVEVGVRPAPAVDDSSVAPPAAEEPPPNAVIPSEEIEGGALPPAETVAPPVEAPPPPPPPPAGLRVEAGAAYDVQPGDTLSGIGRRFQAPLQTLVDLNGLGPQAAIRPGMRLILPDSAIDTGVEARATGPSPRGVRVPDGGVPPPPPPPPSGNPAAPPRGAGGRVVLDWPVRGEVLSRFGATGVSQRNSGIDIGAEAGAPVRASAAGRVGYVGNVIADQGLTVLIVHPDGWRTVYAHLGSESVSEGDDVRAGQTIGTVGRTPGAGPSMHFQVWRTQGDEPRPVDPLTVLPR